VDEYAFLPDDKIIALFYARDERAISETARKYGRLFRRVAFGILGDDSDAEECENDTYLRLWNAIPPVSPSDLGAYGAKTARNAALDALEKKNAARRGGGITFEELDDSLPDISGRLVETEELGALIDSFLRTLGKRDRVMFVLRYFYGEKIEIIAEKCACGASAVKTRLFRIRKRLKAYLEKEGVSV